MNNEQLEILNRLKSKSDDELNQLLCESKGLCWHERDMDFPVFHGIQYKCKKCGYWVGPNPDYVGDKNECWKIMDEIIKQLDEKRDEGRLMIIIGYWEDKSPFIEIEDLRIDEPHNRAIIIAKLLKDRMENG